MAKEIQTEDAPDLAARLTDLPDRSGVYMFKNQRGDILYVGKAKSLRKRVRSYFRKDGLADGRFHIQFLLPQIFDIDTILTNNEKEALILENILIKKYRPLFNIDLRDDKDYVYIRFADDEQWPRVEVVRRPTKKKGVRLFGPYANVKLARETLRQVQRVFPIRTCRAAAFKRRDRPCLNHQIGRCLGLCSGDVDHTDYLHVLDQVALFLQGKQNTLVEDLEARMKKAAAELDFETAAEIRDRLAAIASTLAPQQIEDAASVIERDIIGFYREGESVAIRVLLYRGGRMTGSDDFSFSDMPVHYHEIIGSFIAQYYGSVGRPLPRETVISTDFDGRESYQELFSEIAGRKFEIVVPQAGGKKRLAELADENAAGLFRSRFQKEEQTEKLLAGLARALRLPEIPSRIECYDISEHGGKLAVGSRVVFTYGEANKALYRRYKIKSIEGGDDYAAMSEVLGRRFAERNLVGDPAPDLLIVDGGKGQLNAAIAVLEDLGVTGVELAGLAKARTERDMTAEEVRKSAERVFRPGRKNPIVLNRNSGPLHLLQRVRDETHRFAITYHRLLKRKAGARSILDEIPGVGPQKRKDLLKYFGSLKNIKLADIEQLSAAPGINRSLAETIHSFLRAE